MNRHFNLRILSAILAATLLAGCAAPEKRPAPVDTFIKNSKKVGADIKEGVITASGRVKEGAAAASERISEKLKK